LAAASPHPPDTTAPRSLALSLTLLLVTMAAGAAIRFAPLGLPTVVTKYGGSMLWALTIYWLVSTLVPVLSRPTKPPGISHATNPPGAPSIAPLRWVGCHQILASAILSATIATAIEFFKLYRSPTLDAFRLTLPGILILGHHFSWWDILAYIIAITIGAALDSRIQSRTRAYREESQTK
jgi:hypothetical protein